MTRSPIGKMLTPSQTTNKKVQRGSANALAFPNFLVAFITKFFVALKVPVYTMYINRIGSVMCFLIARTILVLSLALVVLWFVRDWLRR
jgi:hypothetical protein